MAFPTYKSAGTEQASTGAQLTVPWPTHVSGDIALLLVECCGGQAASLATPNGFVELVNSPQATGATTSGTRIHAYWCRATSASMSSPVVNVGANHGYARIFTFNGDIPPSGNPFQVTSGGVKASASTTTTWTDLTTLSENCLVLFVAARDNDSASAAWSSFAGGNVANHAEVSGSDAGTALRNGGGIVLNTGEMATPGAVGTPTATVTSSINAMMTIALSSIHPDIISMVNSGNIRQVCEDADYVYYCTDANPAYVGRISKADWVTKTELNSGVTNLNTICQDATNVYAASYEAPCRVVKIPKSSFTVSATKTLASGENNCRRMTQDSTYVYLGLDLNPTKVVRLQKADWTTTSTKTFSTGESFCNALDIDGTYIYVGHYVSPAKVSRLTISDFSTVSTFTADSGWNSCMSLANDSSYVYAGLAATPSRIVRISKSDWSTQQKYMGDADQGDVRMTIDATKLYAVYDNSPGKMSHINLDDGTTHQRTEFPTGQTQCQTPDVDDDYVYVPFWNSPPKVRRVPIRIPLQQEGFRWRDDDNNEASATWLETQDTQLERGKNTNTRLRILLNGTVNLATNKYKLQYKKTTDSEWLDVRPDYSGNYVSETFAATPDTTRIEIGGDAVWNAGGYLQLTTAANDKKGWTGYIGELPDDFVTTFDIYANGTADGIHFYFGCTGNDGNAEQANGGYHFFFDEYHSEIAIWYNGSKITSVSQANLGNGTFRTARVERIGGTRFKIDLDGVNKIDYTDSSRTLIGTQFGWAARTGGLNAEHRYKNITLYSASFTQAIILSPSSNIGASGAATTVQLTAPSGKTTSNFVAGRIQDDENPADAVSIMLTKYTEMEWCLMATDEAVEGGVYEFRVVYQETPVVPLSTYTVTPQWTVAEPVEVREPSPVPIEITLPAVTTAAHYTAAVAAVVIELTVAAVGVSYVEAHARTPDPVPVEIAVVQPAVSHLAVYSRAPSPVPIEITPIAPTTSYVYAVSRAPQPVPIDITIPAPAVTYVYAVSRSVEPVLIEITPVTPARSYIQVETTAPDPIEITLTPVQPATAFVETYNRNVSPVPIDITVIQPAVSHLAVYSRAPSPVPIEITVPAVTRSYVYAESRTPEPVPVDITVIQPGVTHAEIYNRALTPVPIEITPVQPAVSHLAVYGRTPSSVLIEITVPEVQADNIYFANPDPVLIELTVPQASVSHEAHYTRTPSPVPVELTVVAPVVTHEAIYGRAPSPVPIDITIPAVTVLQYFRAAPAPVLVELTPIAPAATYLEPYTRSVSPVPVEISIPAVTTAEYYETSPDPVPIEITIPEAEGIHIENYTRNPDPIEILLSLQAVTVFQRFTAPVSAVMVELAIPAPTVTHESVWEALLQPVPILITVPQASAQATSIMARYGTRESDSGNSGTRTTASLAGGSRITSSAATHGARTTASNTHRPRTGSVNNSGSRTAILP